MLASRSCPLRFIDPDVRSPFTDYYNLKRQLTKHVEDGKLDKKIVLIPVKKEADTDVAISTGHVINQVSNDMSSNTQPSMVLGWTEN